jgi:hypothetical protein
VLRSVVGVFVRFRAPLQQKGATPTPGRRVRGGLPAGRRLEPYFFYRVGKAGPKSVDLLPARQESTDPRADVSATGFFTDKA